MKAILVIDMPVNCRECPCFYDWLFCQAKDGLCVIGDNIPNGCPLKPIPNKLDWKIGYVKDKNTCEIFNKNYVDGYNKCIDEILEGAKE